MYISNNEKKKNEFKNEIIWHILTAASVVPEITKKKLSVIWQNALIYRKKKHWINFI